MKCYGLVPGKESHIDCMGGWCGVYIGQCALLLLSQLLESAFLLFYNKWYCIRAKLRSGVPGSRDQRGRWSLWGDDCYGLIPGKGSHIDNMGGWCVVYIGQWALLLLKRTKQKKTRILLIRNFRQQPKKHYIWYLKMRT